MLLKEFKYTEKKEIKPINFKWVIFLPLMSLMKNRLNTPDSCFSIKLFWNCMFWGSNFKNVLFLYKAILQICYLREQFWEYIFWGNNFERALLKIYFWERNFENVVSAKRILNMVFLREIFWNCIFLRQQFWNSPVKNNLFFNTHFFSFLKKNHLTCVFNLHPEKKSLKIKIV